MAVSDGTAASGLAPGQQTRLGGQSITVAGDAARLADGTLAGSAVTLGRVFRTLVRDVGLPPVQAAILCATTPARELGLRGQGALVAGGLADLAILDRDFTVTATYVGGRPAWPPA